MKKIITVISLFLGTVPFFVNAQKNQQSVKAIAVRAFTVPYIKDADDTNHTAYLNVKTVDNLTNDSDGRALCVYTLISCSGKITGQGKYETTYAEYHAWPTDGDDVNNYPFELVAAYLKRPINSSREIKIHTKQ